MPAVDDMLESGTFGDAGAEVVIEEFLGGEEASFFVLCDGETALPLASAQDHKRVGDGDTGPNTGGMGAYSPAPIVTDAWWKPSWKPSSTRRWRDEAERQTLTRRALCRSDDENDQPKLLRIQCPVR